MITFLFWTAVVGCCLFAVGMVCITAKILIDAPDRNARHASAEHHWAGRLTEARHAYQAAVNMPGMTQGLSSLAMPGLLDLPGPARAESALEEGARVPGRAGAPVPGPEFPPAGPGTTLPVAYWTGRTPGQRQLLWQEPGAEDTAVDLLPVIRETLGGTSVKAVLDYLFHDLQTTRWASP
jgi:hypothetical protein